MKLLALTIFFLVAFSLVESALNVRSVSRADRVKRDWLSDIMFRGYQDAYEPRMPNYWTGWRCHGTNGIFLDCAGR
ncbi:hypothetical protein QR680_001223 [Steinernema hermaphroditum]|uniref:Uncharacterized protein n=1 Tax=Steinernema hermaphroditum TaxID=289476 RepID=A0AA39LFG3_9BILA|nr:hypothetical protein QR680_001223 [Steinernema hermaphroditum]